MTAYRFSSSPFSLQYDRFRPFFRGEHKNLFEHHHVSCMFGRNRTRTVWLRDCTHDIPGIQVQIVEPETCVCASCQASRSTLCLRGR